MPTIPLSLENHSHAQTFLARRLLPCYRHPTPASIRDSGISHFGQLLAKPPTHTSVIQAPWTLAPVAIYSANWNLHKPFPLFQASHATFFELGLSSNIISLKPTKRIVQEFVFTNWVLILKVDANSWSRIDLNGDDLVSFQTGEFISLCSVTVLMCYIDKWFYIFLAINWFKKKTKWAYEYEIVDLLISKQFQYARFNC